MKKDKIYLQHILEAINKIEKYSEAVSEEEFLEDSMRQDAIIRQIQIIGEAAKQISNETKIKSKPLPWKDIAGMRDKLTHGYFGVDLKAVWKTVIEDIPSLKKEILTLLVKE